jgi:LysM repeat protein
MFRGVMALILCALLAAGPARGQEQAQPATYVVEAGDTLYSIAQRFGISVATLQRLNDLEGTTIEVGQTLAVRPPGAPTPADTTAQSEAATADTIVSDTSAQAAMAADTLAADTSTATPEASGSSVTGESELSPRRSLTRRPPVSLDAFGTEVPASRTLIDGPINRLTHGAYVVQPGDTFYSVAARFGTTGDSLFALNGQWADPLPAEQVLRLPPRFALPAHTVQPSDSTLYVIAAEYGVSVRALRQLNDLEADTLTAGRRLRIPGRRAPKPAPRGTLPPADAQGAVAVYPAPFEGRLTASGARYDPDALVVSHPSLPFGSVVLLTNPTSGQSTFARVIDRGPVEDALLVDVSEAVAARLGLAAQSDQLVALRIVE